jgi:hypothetical protein
LKQARFTKPARAELLGQTVYFETIEKGLGSRFRSEVEAVSQRAAAFPLHDKQCTVCSSTRLQTAGAFLITG